MTEEGSWLEQLIVAVCSFFALAQVAEVRSTVLPSRITVQQRRGPLRISRPNKQLDDCLTKHRGDVCLWPAAVLPKGVKQRKKDISKTSEAFSKQSSNNKNRSDLHKPSILSLTEQFALLQLDTRTKCTTWNQMLIKWFSSFDSSQISHEQTSGLMTWLITFNYSVDGLCACIRANR